MSTARQPSQERYHHIERPCGVVCVYVCVCIQIAVNPKKPGFQQQHKFTRIMMPVMIPARPLSFPVLVLVLVRLPAAPTHRAPSAERSSAGFLARVCCWMDPVVTRYVEGNNRVRGSIDNR